MRHAKAAIEIKYNEKQAWKKNERTAEYPARNQRDYRKEGQPDTDTPGLYDPGVDTEETECSGIKEISAGSNELEKIAIEDLTMNNTHSASEEQNLIVDRNKGNGR